MPCLKEKGSRLFTDIAASGPQNCAAIQYHPTLNRRRIASHVISAAGMVIPTLLGAC